MTGHEATVITYPVRLLTDTGSHLSSLGQSPAKSASTKTSTSSNAVGHKISPLSTVPFKY